MLDIFEQEPYFTNEQGISFWIDESTNNYLKSCKIRDYQAWVTKDLNDYKERILVCSDKVVYATQQWEAMLCHIDFMKLKRDLK